MFVTKADTVGKVTTWLSLTRCYHPHFGYKGTHKTHMLVQSIPTKLHTIETKMGPYWQRIRPFFYIFFLAYSFSSSLDHLFFSATMRLNMAFLTPPSYGTEHRLRTQRAHLPSTPKHYHV